MAPETDDRSVPEKEPAQSQSRNTAPDEAGKADGPRTTTEQTQPNERSDVLPPLRWRADAYRHTEKDSSWYWAVAIIGLSAAITAAIFSSYLFAALIVIATITLSLYASRPPHKNTIEVDDSGVLIEDEFYPFQNLEAFWIDEEEEWENALLILRSRKLLTPLVSTWIDEEEVDPSEIREHLLQFLDEEEMSEPLTQRFLEWLGF